jgi:hypothetical protein
LIFAAAQHILDVFGAFALIALPGRFLPVKLAAPQCAAFFCLIANLRDT